MTGPGATTAEAFSLAGKTVLVTGASRGIGFAIAEGAARLGAAHVILGGIEEDETREAAETLAAAGHSAEASIFDAFDEAAVVGKFREFKQRFGVIDCVYSNAGMNIAHPALDMSGSDFRKVVDANLVSHFNVGREAGNLMRQAGRGSIVFTASITSLVGRPRLAAYTSAKSGLGGLTRSLAGDLGPYGARVNAICPGFVETKLSKRLVDNREAYDRIGERVALGRWAMPDDVSGPALFLSMDAARYVNGHMLVIDGGLTQIFEETPFVRQTAGEDAATSHR